MSFFLISVCIHVFMMSCTSCIFNKYINIYVVGLQKRLGKISPVSWKVLESRMSNVVGTLEYTRGHILAFITMLKGLIEVVDWLVHNSAFTVLHIQGVQKKITQTLMHCNIAIVNCRVLWFSPKYS